MRNKLIDEETLRDKLNLDVYSESTALSLHVVMTKPDIKCNRGDL